MHQVLHENYYDVTYGSAMEYVSLKAVWAYSVTYMLIDMDALQYTIPIFGFSSLHTLRQYLRDRNLTNVYDNLLLLYILIITIPHINT